MTLFSFRWDNVPSSEVDQGLYMCLLVDQTHTKKQLRFIVPVEMINEMCTRDTTPGNEEWWTLDLSLAIVVS